MKTTVTKSLVAALFAVAFFGCGGDSSAIDYSNSENWLSLPSPGEDTRPIDVFYLYPTQYVAAANGPLISEIDDANMVAGAKIAFQKQATAFEALGNIYAPYYRQADAVRVLSLPTVDAVYNVIGDVPESDATEAFDYFIKHYNKDRPFILASHSQGSTVVALLLKNYLKDHPLVYRRMIAAYAIGWSFTPEFFTENPHLRFATAADDTGVIISYNTQAPSLTGRNPIVFPGALAINPITWTLGGEEAAAAQNLGSLRLDATGAPLIPPQPDAFDFADARVTHIDPTTSAVDPASDTSVVFCSTVDPASTSKNPIDPGFYHNYDYPFYYSNIRENAALRTARFLSR